MTDTNVPGPVVARHPLAAPRGPLAASRERRQVASEVAIPVRRPYRLDLTVNALRRLATNLVDIFTADGRYLRAIDGAHGVMVLSVVQRTPDALTVTLDGDRRDRAAALALVSRTLGVDRDLAHFDRAAARVPWLRPLARRMRGVKPPRYPTLWEACVNAVAFQQVSLHAASAIVARLITGLGSPVERRGAALYPFPSPARFQAADDGALRRAGLSVGKVATLRRAAAALGSGALDEMALERTPTPEAAGILRELKGIGPWTAAVILLRGLGRLDVFPSNDSGVARSLRLLVSPAPSAPEIDQVLAALGPQRGMLYYHLLLARLEARGNITA